MVYDDITELIGKTPLLKLNRYSGDKGFKAEIYAKLEYFNPAGSIKDRVGKALIEAAEKAGKLKPGATVIEPTSGNTGIGLASVAASRGYRAIFTMPETMSIERRKLIAAYGAEIVLTPGSEGMKGAIAKADELNSQIEGSFVPGQFVNPANPKAHYETTGSEIWDDTDGKVDIFVSAVGTGGTLTGIAAYLKEQNPDIKAYAVEPKESPVLSGGRPGIHKIQGIGAEFVPETLDTSLYDGVITVRSDDAFEASREFAVKEGVLVGISSGAAIWAAAELAKKDENIGKIIVTILPDSGERYLSTELY